MRVFLPCLIRNSSALLLLLALALIISACGGDKNKSAKRDKTVLVSTVDVVVEDVPYTLNAVGNVEALASVEIKSRVGGIIAEQLVSNGQDVQKGDLLFRIDPRFFDLAVMEAQAKLDRDRAYLNKARKNLKRYSKLREMNVVAQDQFDNTYAESTSLENTIHLNEAALEKAKLDREYARITAPISGRVGIVHVNEGNVIKANDDRTLCVINQIQPINVAFSLPERYLGEIMQRLVMGPVTVSVTPSGINPHPLKAELTAVDNSVDTSTGTIRLLATYPNTDLSFWPGQFARVDLTLQVLKDVLLVPTRAVMQGLTGPYVYVITPPKDPSLTDGGIAEARDVVTSYIVGERTIVEKGLQAREKIVLDGQVALAPGIKVKIKNPPSAKSTEKTGVETVGEAGGAQ